MYYDIVVRCWFCVGSDLGIGTESGFDMAVDVDIGADLENTLRFINCYLLSSA